MVVLSKKLRPKTELYNIFHLYIPAISKDNINIAINEPLFSTSRRCYWIISSVKHCDRRSELALIKPTFHVSSVFILILNQLRQIFQTTHSHFCQCRIQWASLIELSSLTDQSGVSYNHKWLRSPEHDMKYTALNSFLCLSLLSFVQDKSCLYTF